MLYFNTNVDATLPSTTFDNNSPPGLPSPYPPLPGQKLKLQKGSYTTEICFPGKLQKISCIIKHGRCVVLSGVQGTGSSTYSVN